MNFTHIALLFPIALTRRWVPPAPGITPENHIHSDGLKGETKSQCTLAHFIA